MWVAKKAFYYRGVHYERGATVPAENWTSRNALYRLKRIVQVADPPPPPPPPVDYKTLNREELNEYAVEHGITDPKSYSKKEELVKALEDLESPQSEETKTETSVEPSSQEPPVDSAVPESTEAPQVPNDDLFADDSDLAKPESST